MPRPTRCSARRWRCRNTGKCRARCWRVAANDSLPASNFRASAAIADACRVASALRGARLYIAGGRYADARRELQRVIAETTPTFVADCTVKDIPRAKELLASIKDKS